VISRPTPQDFQPVSREALLKPNQIEVFADSVVKQE
jgi:hypothetical protein